MGQEAFAKLWSGYEGTYDQLEDSFFTLRIDLSYVPDNPRITLEDARFLVWREYYIEGSKVKEAENLIKEIAALYKSKNITNRWNMLKGGIGYDAHWYESAEYALSAVDYYTHKQPELETLGEDFVKLWGKFMDATEKYEVSQGYYRPDLSYTPKESEENTTSQ
ncbi:MAG: hypothetical protein R6U40_05040 [Desulfobacterales bacterium]